MADDKEPTMAQAVAKYEPATGIDDLDTALRLITCLRQEMIELREMSEPVEGEISVYLSEEYHEKAEKLYEMKMFGFPGDPTDDYWLDPPDFDEAFTDFVQWGIDLAWDTGRDSMPKPPRKRGPTLSA